MREETHREGLWYHGVQTGPACSRTDRYWAEVELLRLFTVLQTQREGMSARLSKPLGWKHRVYEEGVPRLPLVDLQCGRARVHIPRPAENTRSTCQLKTPLKGFKVKMGEKKSIEIYLMYCACACTKNRWDSRRVSYLDLYSHSDWDWRTWWGTCSWAASGRAPGERPGRQGGKWRRWDWSPFLDGHSLPSGPQP